MTNHPSVHNLAFFLSTGWQVFLAKTLFLFRKIHVSIRFAHFGIQLLHCRPVTQHECPALLKKTLIIVVHDIGCTKVERELLGPTGLHSFLKNSLASQLTDEQTPCGKILLEKLKVSWPRNSPHNNDPKIHYFVHRSHRLMQYSA